MAIWTNPRDLIKNDYPEIWELCELENISEDEHTYNALNVVRERIEELWGQPISPFDTVSSTLAAFQLYLDNFEEE